MAIERISTRAAGWKAHCLSGLPFWGATVDGLEVIGSHDLRALDLAETQQSTYSRDVRRSATLPLGEWPTSVELENYGAQMGKGWSTVIGGLTAADRGMRW